MISNSGQRIPRFGASYFVNPEKYIDPNSVARNRNAESLITTPPAVKFANECGKLLSRCQEGLSNIFEKAGQREKQNAVVELKDLSPEDASTVGRFSETEGK